MSTELIPSPAPAALPALFAPTPKSAKRVLEFFTAQINNDHTRKAHLNATRRFAACCGERGIGEFAGVQPFHVAAFVKHLQGELSPPTVKQHLAALRMLFDWLVTGHVMDVNPAHSVRGPKYVVKKGKTPGLAADEARELLDAIVIARKTKRPDGAESEEPVMVGLRDRALIGTMVYTFARVNAVLEMKVSDYFVQGRCGCMKKAARSTRFPAITISNSTSMNTSRPPNKGTLEAAQHIANHESPRTTKLYDRRQDEISLDEVERIAI
jgi:site-specific recombinase XerD